MLTLYTIWRIAKNIVLAGVDLFLAHWRVILPIIAVLVLAMFVYRACNKPPKLDQVQINKINSQIERERKAELQKVVEENSDVIKTVDERTEITNINVIERNREIDKKVAEADKAIVEAKNQGRDVTQEELECLLIPSNCS